MEIIDWVKRQTGKIADNVKDYRFYVKHQPSIIDSSTTLVLTTFTNRDEVAAVPCIYKWSRVKNGLTTQATEFKGSSFICQPSDVGTILQAQITSTDPQHGGTAIMQFGPVKLDVFIKKQIEHALGTGSAVMNVDLVQKNDVKDCQIKIMEDNMTINHCHSPNGFTFDYSIGQPRIQVSQKETTKVIIAFSQKQEAEVVKFVKNIFGNQDLIKSYRSSNEHKLELKFNTRATRDNFLFIMKAFITKKAMKNSVIMNKIQQIDFNESLNFNYTLEINSLRTDIYKLGKLNDKYLADKKMYHKEARKYEKEIEQTIVTYTKIVENKWKTTNELDKSIMELREKRDQVMDRKLQNLVRENQVLNDRVAFLNAELEKVCPRYQKENSNSIATDFVQKGGFAKKKEGGEIFQNILHQVNESSIHEPNHEKQIGQLNEQKRSLSRKLKESFYKIMSLEEKVKRYEQEKRNHSAINFHYGGNKSDYVFERYATEFENGQSMIDELNNLKLANSHLIEENKKLKIDYLNTSQKKQKLLEINSKKSASSKGSQNPEEKRATRERQLLLRKKIEQLSEQNNTLKNQIFQIIREKQILLKEKSVLEQKYRRRVDELTQEISMFKKNQDALNRSQHISMQMDLYNEEQNQLLKQQNELLINENAKLSKLCEKYLKEAKQIPKMREEIIRLQKDSERKKTDLSYSKSEEELLLDDKILQF